ncbi:MAG: 4-hydroxy-tetrahydrodipicolinate reductase [Candidatus Cloacimonetes bacterium]|nr:4-hydroxy-tetrahydrodipicolinate reductase [Candidatus Cloacimonadota bacterium]
MLKIAIIGYGQMGKLLVENAENYGCKIVSIIDPNYVPVNDSQAKVYSEINEKSLRECEVCIEFTHPSVVVKNVLSVIELKKKIVIGTTGWEEKKEQIFNACKQNKTDLIYSANYSLGINLFYRIIEFSSQIMSKINQYDIWAYEMHHNKKGDSPSGTAKELAKIILEKYSSKQTAVYDKLDRKINPEEFHFGSIRGGSIPGTHVIGFDSAADSIELKHTARNRSGFAAGALLAAKWISDKKGIYNFRDIFASIMGIEDIND